MRRLEAFSLIELIMVIAILGILAIFVGPVVFNAMRSYQGVQSGLETQAKMRYAMERMSRELREIRRQATDAALVDITSMTATSITFFKTDGTQVVIERAGNVVNLAYPPLTGVLTNQVAGFSLAYFQPNTTTVAATASSLAFIQVSLDLSEGTNLFSTRVRVDLRNPP